MEKYRGFVLFLFLDIHLFPSPMAWNDLGCSFGVDITALAWFYSSCFAGVTFPPFVSAVHHLSVFSVGVAPVDVMLCVFF